MRGNLASFHLFKITPGCCVWYTALTTGGTINQQSPKGLKTLTKFTRTEQLTTAKNTPEPETGLTAQRACIWTRPVAQQLVLERRAPAADVHVRDGFDEERPLPEAEAAHLAPSLLLLAHQQAQLAAAVQVDVGASGLRRGFDADGEAGGARGDGVGPQVHDDGPRWIEPLQGALRATQVHLLHVPGVAFVHQTAGRKEQEGHQQNVQQNGV